MAKQTRGKRYSVDEKAEILSFVEEVNANKGRGGVSAASKKFGVSQLTVSSWLKKSGAPSAGRGGFGGNLRRLADIHDEIAVTKKKLASLEKEFSKLKAKL